MPADNPILNGPSEEPQRHYATDDGGALDYARVVPKIGKPDRA